MIFDNVVAILAGLIDDIAREESRITPRARGSFSLTQVIREFDDTAKQAMKSIELPNRYSEERLPSRRISEERPPSRRISGDRPPSLRISEDLISHFINQFIQTLRVPETIDEFIGDSDEGEQLLVPNFLNMRHLVSEIIEDDRELVIPFLKLEELHKYYLHFAIIQAIYERVDLYRLAYEAELRFIFDMGATFHREVRLFNTISERYPNFGDFSDDEEYTSPRIGDEYSLYRPVLPETSEGEESERSGYGSSRDSSLEYS